MSQIYPEESLLKGAAESVWKGSDARICISIDVSNKLISEMTSYLTEYLSCVFITDSDIRHIKKKHGSTAEKLRGQIEITPDDFSRIPLVLNDFDTCEHIDTDKLGNKKFLIKKNIGDEIFIVTIQRGKRKLGIKTMWKENRSGASC